MNRWHRRFLGITSLPAELTDFEIGHYFTLTPAAVAAVQSRYKDNHRIAVAIQLGFLKLSGRRLPPDLRADWLSRAGRTRVVKAYCILSRLVANMI